MRFTIRLKPQEGESLSSYLFRCCLKNKYSMESIWRIICLTEAGKYQRKKLQSWDMNPYVYLDLKKTAHLTGQSEELLISLTYLWVARKLIQSGEINKISFQSIDGFMHFNVAVRKVCILCISEGTGHRLLWNVKGVQCCKLHKCQLTDHCHKCKYQFDYFSDFFIQAKCPNCDEDLFKGMPCSKTFDEISNNESFLSNWEWLLGNEKSNGQYNYSTCQTFALKLLYEVQKLRISGISYKSWYIILKKVVVEGNRSVSLSTIFIILNLAKKTLRDINEIHLTREIIEDVLRYPHQRTTPLGKCLTPWCRSFSEDRSMVKANNPYRFGDRKGYKYCSVCVDCFIEYGYSKQTGVWENVGGSLMLIQEVKLQESIGKKHSEIYKSLGIGIEKLTEVLTYLDYYVGTDFYPKSQIHPDEAVNYIKQLITIRGCLPRKAKKVFGWSFSEVFAIFAMREVKSFLYFDSHEFRKRGNTKESLKKIRIQKELLKYSNSNTKLSLEEVAASLETTRAYLLETGLSKVISSNNRRVYREMLLREREQLTLLATEFITGKQERIQPWLKGEIYKKIGIRGDSLKHNHKELYDYIEQQYIIMKQMIKENELSILVAQADQVVKELRKAGGTILTKKVVCERMGFTYNKVLQTRPRLLSHIGALVNLE